MGLAASEIQSPRSTASPFEGAHFSQWFRIARPLAEGHPLFPGLFRCVRQAWNEVLGLQLFGKPLRSLGVSPQVLGVLFHEALPIVVSEAYPEWRGPRQKSDEDLTCSDPQFSVEVKVSSHPTTIFGNRSFVHSKGPKSRNKAGFYLAVNFDPDRQVLIRTRFGWLDPTDWVAQKAESGQQAYLAPNSAFKLVDLDH